MNTKENSIKAQVTDERIREGDIPDDPGYEKHSRKVDYPFDYRSNRMATLAHFLFKRNSWELHVRG